MSASVPPTSTGSTKLDAIKQTAAAADPTKPQGLDLYSRFAFAGAVCCSVTHGALTPVDVYVLRTPSTRRCAPMGR
jgi:solute carrier family 25 phosphate transporter 3